ncbi:MAG: tetratricopeptide repeat protein [Acidobacteriia bacterium]|nr:tetratricopeptide repeat protein [Terriglobia bacterium]
MAKRSRVRKSDKNSSRPALLERLYKPEWLLVLAALLCDLNSWGHQFVVDDHARILSNPLVTDATRLFSIFSHSSDPASEVTTGLYRPITVLSYAINSWVTGLHYDGFHLVNRLLHVLITLMVFWCIRLLIEKPQEVALFSALIFAVHPIQTEAVTYVSGRPDALAMVFFAAAWFYFLRLRSSGQPAGKYLWLSMIYYCLGLLSKENAVTFLGVVFLTDWLYECRRNGKLYLSIFKEGFWKAYAGFAGVTGLFLAIRVAVLKSLAPMQVDFYLNPLAHASIFSRTVTGLKILFQNLALFFYPRLFSADYSYNQVPLVTQWSSPPSLLILAGMGLLVVFLLWSYRRSRELFFGLAFFLITYSIVSNLFIPIGTIRADRLLYLPCLGLCVIVGFVMTRLQSLARESIWRRVFQVFLVMLILVLMGRTLARNGDWKDEFTLYYQTVQSSPRSTKAHLELGNQYYYRKQYDLALEHYRTAESLQLSSDHAESAQLFVNLGNLYLKIDRARDGVQNFQKALKLDPRNRLARGGLGLAYLKLNQPDAAISEFDRLIQNDPSDTEARFNRGYALQVMQRIPEAIVEYQTVLGINPNFPNARAILNQLIERQSK